MRNAELIHPAMLLDAAEPASPSNSPSAWGIVIDMNVASIPSKSPPIQQARNATR